LHGTRDPIIGSTSALARALLSPIAMQARFKIAEREEISTMKGHSMRAVSTAMAVGAMVTLLAMPFDADAASARVKCRVKGDRTQISVDGRSLPAGTYTASVDSTTDGAGAVPSNNSVTLPPGNEAEFDFDSDAGDIAEGATPLPAGFATVGGSIVWTIQQGGLAFLSGTQACTQK
jgi:hypothetical protein